ncbi:probable LRR receptor-like serine/threonine-protein kinase At1g05700 [Eucalyptus grandis]|uniref:probable LRR receptor-like serine/threonine-protein kinase At1g05700 n=1 Tax=Eucalyptus grandis TaxID=71139 RepID=UPI00192F0405|nr:probable LRR receptor-like serine/threonine-protein kinase At1g05700 [Eucalyptus grandis]
MERSIALFLCASIASLAPAIMLLVQAQINPEGFISIDCGASDPYTDDTTKIYYETDQEFTESGRSMNVSLAAGPRFLETLRSFPDGMRNCYSLKPEQGENKPYLIRASFLYGSYDGKNQTPTFDLYIDVNKWSTINSYYYEKREIVYVAQRDVVQVCVVNIGKGVPFISALELRALNDVIYPVGSGFQKLWWRQNLGSSGSSIRYPADVYDRIWDATIYPYTTPLSTTYTQTLSENSDEYKVPAEVLSTAVDGGYFLNMWLNSSDSLSKWIVYFHFADFKRLPEGQQRELTISTNNNQFTRKVSGSGVNFSIKPTGSQSGVEAILNALETYIVADNPNVPTTQDDATANSTLSLIILSAIHNFFCGGKLVLLFHFFYNVTILKKIIIMLQCETTVKVMNDAKVTLRVNKESWQGDPCVPREFAWDGLNCSYTNDPRIVSLKLSSSNLTGSIASSLSNLEALEVLDLSNNQLTGGIPETLAKLPKLRILNLSGNNLTGAVPEDLQKRVAADKTFNLRLVLPLSS